MKALDAIPSASVMYPILLPRSESVPPTMMNKYPSAEKTASGDDWFLRGVAAFVIGDVTDAVSSWQKALELDPKIQEAMREYIREKK